MSIKHSLHQLKKVQIKIIPQKAGIQYEINVFSFAGWDVFFKLLLF